VVGTDFPKGVHHVCVAVQTKDLFLGSSDREFASVLNVLVVRQIKSSEAGLGEVRKEDIPPLAKVGLPHLVAALEIRGREFLIGLRVTNRNHIVDSNLRSDGDIAGEIKMNWQRDEFVQRHEVVRCDEWYVEDQHECFVFWFVHVRGFDEEEI
jgi:hypothetical protein